MQYAIDSREAMSILLFSLKFVSGNLESKQRASLTLVVAELEVKSEYRAWSKQSLDYTSTPLDRHAQL